MSRAAPGRLHALAEKRLQAVAGQALHLAGAAAVQQAILPLLRAAGAPQPPPDLDVAVARQSLAAGQPIMTGQEFSFDLEAAAHLFRQLAQAVEKALRGPAGRQPPVWMAAGSHDNPVTAIHQTARRGRLDLPKLWRALATGDAAALEALATSAGLEEQWLRLLGESTLQPALRAWQAAASRAIGFADWQRGTCPVCGSLPFLAEVQGKEGARQLRCGLCAAAWPYPRVKCAFCANTNHLSLGTLSLVGEAEKYRVQTCDVCHGYVKVVVTFDPIPDDMLPVEDLATYPLDLVAAERGYSRAPVRA